MMKDSVGGLLAHGGGLRLTTHNTGQSAYLRKVHGETVTITHHCDHHGGLKREFDRGNFRQDLFYRLKLIGLPEAAINGTRKKTTGFKRLTEVE
jgi:hypothetical protein